MKTENVKGFRDIEDANKKIAIRNIIENNFKLYNYKPVETPTIESAISRLQSNLSSAKSISSASRNGEVGSNNIK